MPRRIIAAIALLALALGLAGCGGGGGDMEKFAGAYLSTSSDYRATIQLNEDGSAYYQQESLKSGRNKQTETTWEIDDGRVVVAKNDAVGYDIYAEAKDPSSLVFKADESRWQEKV